MAVRIRRKLVALSEWDDAQGKAIPIEWDEHPCGFVTVGFRCPLISADKWEHFLSRNPVQWERGAATADNSQTAYYRVWGLADDLRRVSYCKHLAVYRQDAEPFRYPVECLWTDIRATPQPLMRRWLDWAVRAGLGPRSCRYRRLKRRLMDCPTYSPNS